VADTASAGIALWSAATGFAAPLKLARVPPACTIRKPLRSLKGLPPRRVLSMPDVLAASVDWLAGHPLLAGLAVFLISAAESLVGVGLFIPGTFVMFGIGALVAFGALDLWETIAWAAAGAVVGDGLSFWIGRRYRDDLRGWWPFSRHPEWLERSEAFFRRHGSKSVLFGRFAGPVRPLVPAVAGMLGMPPARFYLVNVLSAITWAPAYILPGVVLGASLEVAATVATRLVVLLGGLIAALWLTATLVRRAYQYLAPRLDALLLRLLVYADAHPALRGLTNGVLDRNHPDFKPLLELATAFIVGLWLLASLLVLQVADPLPRGVDYRVNYLAQHLHSPWADPLMVTLALAHSVPVSAAVLLAGAGWLAWRRRADTLTHWLGAVAGPAVAAAVLQRALAVGPVREDLQAVVTNTGFPSLETAFAVAVFGFLAVVLAEALPAHWRRRAYSASGVLLVAGALGQLYLARHWASAILGGAMLAFTWTVFVGIAYRRHSRGAVRWQGLLGWVGAALLAGLGAQFAITGDAALAQLDRPPAVHRVDADAWWADEWARLPAHRVDWAGEAGEPLNVQWAGDAGALAAHLAARGWQVPASASLAGALAWLSPHPALADLPVLPRVHDGRHETLIRALMVPADPVGGIPPTRLVLRLWPTDTALAPGGDRLWVGSVSRQRVRGTAGLLQLPRSEPPGDAELAVLATDLAGLDQRRARQPLTQPGRQNGMVLLVREPRVRPRAETTTLPEHRSFAHPP
jgi:membrane protein DedA with SNARE-associated domain